MVNLIRIGWGSDNDAFRQLFTSLFIPDGTPEQHQWWTELERLTSSAENAARMLETFYQVDVSERARQLDVPTLVLHPHGDARVPYEEGRRLAALIPGARFVTLDSRNHVLLAGEPAFDALLSELHAFLAPASAAWQSLGLTGTERAVLELLAQGLDNHRIAQQLGKSEKTVRNQVSAIFAKLGVHTRAEAIVRARESGGAG